MITPKISFVITPLTSPLSRASLASYLSVKEQGMSKPIHQTIIFKATPHEVYEALMDSKKHAAFTGGNSQHQPRSRR
jgi:hypothetical protein